VQDIADLGVVAAGNDALLKLGSRKITKTATFCPLSPAPSSELHQIFTDTSHMRHTEFHQVQWTLVHFSQIGSPVNGLKSFKIVRLWTRVIWKWGCKSKTETNAFDYVSFWPYYTSAL